MGVIGAGIWGESHAWIYSTDPYTELIAVCDLVETKAKQLAEKYHAQRWYTDVEKMMKDPEIQAVGIATPDFAHRDPFIAACQAGKNILLEKPLATNEDDLKTMRAAYRNSGVRVMVDFHARWNPPLVVAKKISIRE